MPFHLNMEMTERKTENDRGIRFIQERSVDIYPIETVIQRQNEGEDLPSRTNSPDQIGDLIAEKRRRHHVDLVGFFKMNDRPDPEIDLLCHQRGIHLAIAKFGLKAKIPKQCRQHRKWHLR